MDQIIWNFSIYGHVKHMLHSPDTISYPCTVPCTLYSKEWFSKNSTYLGWIGSPKACFKLYIGSTRYNWPFVYIKSFCVFYILLLLFIMFFIGTIYTSHTQEYPQIHYYHPPFKLCLLLFNHNYHSLPSYHKGQRITSLVICSSTIPSTFIRFNGTSTGS